MKDEANVEKQTEIIKHVEGDGDKIFFTNVQKFIRLCEKPVPKNKIQRFSQGNTNFDYVPIDVVETEFKRLFFGLIREHEPNIKVIGNEITATQRFEVFHPIAKQWISVVGWGAVQIRMVSKSDHTNPNNKIKNALQMDMPHLGAEVYKNAMSKLGRAFGRGLRRDYMDEYQELIKDEAKEDLTPEEKKALVEFDKILHRDYKKKMDILTSKSFLNNSASIQFTGQAFIEAKKLIQKRFDELTGGEK